MTASNSTSPSSSPDGDRDHNRPSTSPTARSVAPEVSASPEEDQGHSASSSDSDRGRSSRPKRPPFLTRKSSGTIIVPRSHSSRDEPEEYPPDDARAMSPRRDSAETERLEVATRSALRE